MENKLGYRPSIDGLRAVAILLVIGYHVFPKAVGGGFLGVDIFFVISGFLISTILYREFNDRGSTGVRVILAFYSRRVKRIFPALAVVLAACYVFGLRHLLADQFKDECLNIAASAGFSENLVAARQTGYFDPDSLSRPLLHIWSLGVEEQFYLVWPLIIGIAVKMRFRLLPIVVFIAGSSFFLNFYAMGTTVTQAFYLPQTRLWELSIGAIAAIAFPFLSSHGEHSRDGAQDSGRVGRRKLHEVCAVLGAILIVCGVCVTRWNAVNPSVRALLPTMGAAFIICAGDGAWFNRRILSQRALVWIGVISYPLYLWHWPLLTFSRVTLENGDTPLFEFGAIALATFLAWCTYHFLEIPIRHGSKSYLKVLIPTAAMLALGIVGYVGYRRNGYPERFPKVIRDLDRFAYTYDHDGAWRRGTYFLEPKNSPDDFKVDRDEISMGKPTIMLWGDSFAAHLYPGYKKWFSGEYNIVQRTVMNTAPIVGLDFTSQPECRIFNDYILGVAKRLRPNCVVLAASWTHYDWRRVETTILALKSFGIRHIVLVGPVPEWEGSLPAQLYNYYRKHLGEPLPTRMRLGSREEPGRVDSLMVPFCERLKIEYLSPYKMLSDKDGFITRLGDDADSIVAFDSGHLTIAGSEYLVAKFPRDER